MEHILSAGFEKLLNIGISLSSVQNLDELLDMILSEAQFLTNADSGSIYLVNGDTLIFKTSRSNTYFKKWGEAKTKQVFKSFEIPITKESIAGYVAITGKTLNIPDVSKIPAEAEYKHNTNFDIKYGYHTISTLVTPMMKHDGTIIGVLQLINSQEADKVVPFHKEHERIIMSISSQAAVSIVNVQLTEQLKSSYLDTIFRLSAAAEYRDKETANHIKRVSYYARMLAEKLGMDKEKCELIYWATPMHDIGKLGIPDAILQKPGLLTDEERKIMQYHTVIGAMILKGASSEVLAISRLISLSHHEKFDGTGYPQGIKGEKIPLEGRIVAIADVYDALSCKRCYKDAFPEEKVLSILKESSEKHFDPDLLKIFLDNMSSVNEIKDKYADTEKDFENIRNIESIKINELQG